MSFVLAVDTSQARVCLALLAPGGECIAQSQGQGIEASRELEQLVEEALRIGALELKQLGAIVLGSGPGSFTGLRIGFSFFKGLALALRIPLCSASTFHAAARAAAEAPQTVAVVSDARRDEVFLAVYQFRTKHEVQELVAPCIVPCAGLALRLSKCCRESCRVINLGAQICRLQELRVKQCQVNFAPDLGAIIELERLFGAADRRSRVELLVDQIAALSPLYLREVAAKTISERRANR